MQIQSKISEIIYICHPAISKLRTSGCTCICNEELVQKYKSSVSLSAIIMDMDLKLFSLSVFCNDIWTNGTCSTFLAFLFADKKRLPYLLRQRNLQLQIRTRFHRHPTSNARKSRQKSPQKPSWPIGFCERAAHVNVNFCLLHSSKTPLIQGAPRQSQQNEFDYFDYFLILVTSVPTLASLFWNNFKNVHVPKRDLESSPPVVH